MKRITCLALVFCLCGALLLWGCESDGGHHDDQRPEPSCDSDSVLYTQGIEQAKLLEEIVNTPGYLDLMTSAGAIQERLASLKGQDLSRPESVYKVAFDSEALSVLLSAADVDIDQFSSELRAFLYQRMQNSVPSVLNAAAGADALAAASVCTVSHTYIGGNLEKGCYLLFFYPNTSPVIVSYHKGDNLIDTSATFLFADITDHSLESAQALFSSIGMDQVQVTEVKMDEG